MIVYPHGRGRTQAMTRVRPEIKDQIRGMFNPPKHNWTYWVKLTEPGHTHAIAYAETILGVSDPQEADVVNTLVGRYMNLQVKAAQRKEQEARRAREREQY